MSKTSALLLSGLLFPVLLIAACHGPQTPEAADDRSSDQAAARQTLMDYFRALHEGDFARAADLYGGSYDVMIGHNPGLDPANQPALFQAACTLNGAICLEAALIQPVEEQEPISGEFSFQVTFQNEDGSLLVLGPCCGAPEGDTQSEFSFHVRETAEDHFQVMDLPVYQP